MSSVPSKFREYVWLVNTIHKAGRISFAEINELWLKTYMSEGVEMSRSSFLRHKNAIEEIFGVFIECDIHNDYKYYIGNAHVLENESVQNWMLSTMSVSSMVSESLALQDRILIQSIPFEGGWLEMVINAMKKNVKIAIDYQRYSMAEVRHHVFEPYALKMHDRRWYILAHFHRQAEGDKPERDYFGTFSLDRIKNIELTDEKFTINKDFNANEYFRDCFGIIHGDGTPCMRIRLRAYDQERFYIRDLPIHSSQRVIEETDDHTDFELQMRPTLDFSTFLLSKGNRLEVIEPEWLAHEIYEMHMDSITMYEKSFADNKTKNNNHKNKINMKEVKDMKVLNLIIKQTYFDQILSGEKTQEFREVKPTTIKKLLQLDDEDFEIEDEFGNSQPIVYDAIRFFVGYNKDRDSALVEVKGAHCEIFVDENDEPIEYEFDGRYWVAEQVVYDLGEVIEKNVKAK